MDANKARVAWICALWLVLALECALATKGPRRPKWHDEVAFLCVHNGAALKSNGLENLSTPFSPSSSGHRLGWLGNPSTIFEHTRLIFWLINALSWVILIPQVGWVEGWTRGHLARWTGGSAWGPKSGFLFWMRSFFCSWVDSSSYPSSSSHISSHYCTSSFRHVSPILRWGCQVAPDPRVPGTPFLFPGLSEATHRGRILRPAAHLRRCHWLQLQRS